MCGEIFVNYRGTTISFNTFIEHRHFPILFYSPSLPTIFLVLILIHTGQLLVESIPNDIYSCHEQIEQYLRH